MRHGQRLGQLHGIIVERFGGDAGLGQRAQVAHAVRAEVGEREVLAAMRRRHAGVADREIAAVQLEIAMSVLAAAASLSVLHI